MGMFTETPLFDDPSLPSGWYRKVVQRQTGATAGQWDVYVYNPEGKKFRSRNELRSYLTQIGSPLNSEDFDFSVKGKGHHNKGKSPAKKSLAENSKENIATKKTKNVSPSPASLKTNNTSEKPKRELRRSLRSETKVEPVEEPEDKYITPDEDEDENDEVSNVKLKVKVGYTATGAMIRPALNDGRKKKRRFRNLNVKKKKEIKSTKSSPPAKGTDQSATAKKMRDEKKDAQALRPKQIKSPRKSIEPIAGPSGLQRVKRSPRRLLKRKLSDSKESKESVSEDDDEDLDYVCSLYDNHNSAQPSSEEGAMEIPAKQLKTEELPETKDDEKIGEEEKNSEEEKRNEEEKMNDEKIHSEEEKISEVQTEPAVDAPDLQLGPVADDTTKPDQTMPSQVDPIESMNEPNTESISTEHVETEQVEDMQVVVIGDSDECHNYAKPHDGQGGSASAAKEQKRPKAKAVPKTPQTPGETKKTALKRKIIEKKKAEADYPLTKKVIKSDAVRVKANLPEKSSISKPPAKFEPPSDLIPAERDPRVPPTWDPPRSPYRLVQEYLYKDPWKLLVATIFLNRTTGRAANPLIWDFFRRWPSAEDARQGSFKEMAEFINPLGLHELRARRIIKMSENYLDKQWKHPSDLCGISKYGEDSYRMFCLGQWREVSPTDIMLKLYQDWIFTNSKALKLES